MLDSKILKLVDSANVLPLEFKLAGVAAVI